MIDHISDSTVRRLSSYLRVLDELEHDGETLVSSHRLAEKSGVTPAQVRKDLSYFGSFGRRGMGYQAGPLKDAIRSILGLDRRWRVALVGAGNIGTALFSYKEFARQGFDIVAVFDSAPERVGQRLDEVAIQPMAEFAATCRERSVEIGVIATPARNAQEIADQMVQVGLRGILNFAPRKLFVPPSVALRTVNMAIELESLSFALAQVEHARRAGRRLTFGD
jgi:redox-sensing transcriptional repressor